LGYVTARGGEKAIRNAEALFRLLVPRASRRAVKAVEEGLPYLLDRLMGEGGLWDPSLAAEVLWETGGDLYEAALRIRAHRATLPRLGDARAQEAHDLLLVRRISSAFRDLPGGQVLGPTLDYSLRLLGRDPDPGTGPAEAEAPRRYLPVRGWLAQRGLLEEAGGGPAEDPGSPTPDLTDQPLLFPAPRPLRLQALARADTGALLGLGYSAMRAYNAHRHPTVAELGMGYLEVRIPHPLRGGEVTLGRIRAGFAEVVAHGERGYRLGFSASMGWNEVKVIAGAMLDLEMDRPRHPAREEEFVLLHTEPIEASGFALHYKLPHYVTFLSNQLSHWQEVERAEEV